MRKAALSLLCAVSIICSIQAFGQQYTWKTLSYPPTLGDRYNDIFFTDPLIGWTIRPYVINGDTVEHLGRIYKTTNGGESWEIQLDSIKNHFRCMGFTDSLHGWVMSFGKSDNVPFPHDSTVIFETTNGGRTWLNADHKIVGEKPIGLCGMSVVNRDVVYAVGRVYGPSFFVKTTNSGNTWVSTSMNSVAPLLIDCYFWAPDSGIIVGGTNTNDDSCNAVVFITNDGGKTWQDVYRSDSLGELCWKISFPTKDVGFVSIQNIKSSINTVLRTTDGGYHWKRQILPSPSRFIQGIGFINDTTGWTGGWATKTWQTRTGGDTWLSSSQITNPNRFRFFGDSLGYCAGQSIFKLSVKKPLSANTPKVSPIDVQNYPNPFTTSTEIVFSLDKEKHVMIKLYDESGGIFATVLDEVRAVGNHSVDLDDFFSNSTLSKSGVFYYTIEVEGQQTQRKMLRIQ